MSGRQVKTDDCLRWQCWQQSLSTRRSLRMLKDEKCGENERQRRFERGHSLRGERARGWGEGEERAGVKGVDLRPGE